MRDEMNAGKQSVLVEESEGNQGLLIHFQGNDILMKEDCGMLRILFQDKQSGEKLVVRFSHMKQD